MPDSIFETSELVINMGPQHPSTHGVLRVVLRLDGERVINADVVIGYLHRGIEKLCEQRDWMQIVLITDRMDYIAAASNNLGYCETVEKLMSLEVPQRARYIRTILAELQRIASHCLWLGTHAMDIGAMTVFLYAFRERELILDLFEEYCGARLTYNAMRIGGLPLDIPPGWDAKVRAFCDILDTKVDEYEELLTHNRIWLERTRGVGIISGQDAMAIGLSGPALRGSGVPRDVRKDEPYAAYADFEFDVPIGWTGDTYDRYLVRLEEFRQSDAHHPPGARRASGRADHRQGPAADQAASRRDVSRDRIPEGRDRLLHRQRRKVEHAISLPRPAAIVLQSSGATTAGEGASRGGRRRADWIDRHRAGRGG